MENQLLQKCTLDAFNLQFNITTDSIQIGDDIKVKTSLHICITQTDKDSITVSTDSIDYEEFTYRGLPILKGYFETKKFLDDFEEKGIMIRDLIHEKEKLWIKENTNIPQLISVFISTIKSIPNYPKDWIPKINPNESNMAQMYEITVIDYINKINIPEVTTIK